VQDYRVRRVRRRFEVSRIRGKLLLDSLEVTFDGGDFLGQHTPVEGAQSEIL